MSVRTSMTSLLLGGVLLVAAPLAWQQSLPDDDAGDPTATAPVDVPSTTTDRSPQGDPSPGPGTATVAPATTGPEPTDATDAAEAAPGVPTRVRAPSIDLDAPLDAVGLEDDGAMELPDDVDRVGWYEPGVRPGEAGSAVLAGHVDSRTQGPGVLFDLRRLEPGDEVATVDADGWTWNWEVVARSTHDRDELPIDELFRWEGPQQLRIITCGGSFDADRGGYTHNVVIHAVPRGQPQPPASAADDPTATAR